MREEAISKLKDRLDTEGFKVKEYPNGVEVLKDGEVVYQLLETHTKYDLSLHNEDLLTKTEVFLTTSIVMEYVISLSKGDWLDQSDVGNYLNAPIRKEY